MDRGGGSPGSTGDHRQKNIAEGKSTPYLNKGSASDPNDAAVVAILHVWGVGAGK
jgi:hypothetical protein